ncbi:hypothetical protein ACEU6E_10825 (plasmid) [Halorutilales archaeon Cl-col2-1]
MTERPPAPSSVAVEIIPIEAVEPVSGAGFGDYFDQLLFTVENCGLESNV